MRMNFFGIWNLAATAFLVVVVGAFAAEPFTQKGAVVTCGSVRITGLAPMLARLEYSPSGRFTDASTAVILNRNLAQRGVKAVLDQDWLVVTSGDLVIRYKKDSGALEAGNLSIAWRSGKAQGTWKPGDADAGNLGGPHESFNSIMELTAVGEQLPPFPSGPLSRSGRHVLDDSATPVWDAEADWIKPRPEKGGQDWYFFGYGRDFKGFFRTYVSLTGPIPLIPRYTLGAWITDLNFEYTGQTVKDTDLKAMLMRFRAEKIPLDVFVLDFAWHKYGWKGGLDWSPIFPDPPAFLRWARENGIKITLNDHPHSGLFEADSHHNLALRALGRPLPAAKKWLDNTGGWKFQTDPQDQGVAGLWFAPEFDDSAWKPMPVPGNWEKYGFAKYDGIGWYRKVLELPEKMRGKKLFASFMGVDDEYDLYVNGKLMAHHGGPGQSLWDKLTQTEVSAALRPDGRNVLALRVKDWGRDGGISGGGPCGGGGPTVVSNEEVINPRLVLNLARQDEAKVFMDQHNALVDQGVDFWWIDGQAAWMDGLNGQMWSNRVYYDLQETHTGRRSFIFSRFGGPGNHRYPGFFTGDCYSNWKVLEYEVPYTLVAGNTLNPYVTHDIGGFIGRLEKEFELYARWVQFGAFSPMLRLHSAHENPWQGNARLPWNYGQKGIDLARKFFALRYRLIPYLYTLTRQAHDTGLPLARAMYLDYPEREEAYSHTGQYLLGDNLLVAPITAPAQDGVAAKEVWFPPGSWTDIFTGETQAGDRVATVSCPLDRMPVFARAGAILPQMPDMDYIGQKPMDTLILEVFASAPGAFTLYEDDGDSLEYRKDSCARTELELEKAKDGGWDLTVAATRGNYKGQMLTRAIQVRMHLAQAPRSVTGTGLEKVDWTWDEKQKLADIRLPARSIGQAAALHIQ